MPAWDAFLQWLSSDAGAAVLSGAVIPFFAVLTAGLLAAAIARGGMRRLMAQRDGEIAAGVIAALVDSAHDATSWATTPAGERSLVDRQSTEAELRMRLLPLPGADTAAEWASHEVAQLRRASSAYSTDFAGPLGVFRSRLVEWHRKPRKATRAFAADLARWASEERADEQRLQHQQDDWLPPREVADDSPLLLDLPTAGVRPARVEAPTATIP
ncbi:MAG: hypothetical protein JWP66_1406 [Naasia sp.]|nr:hypothetical protein [Naasia sp.]